MVTLQTKENLKFVLFGECRQVGRYSIFAEKAEEEGFKNLAKLFRKAVKQEELHAKNYFKVLKMIKPTGENLKMLIKGEEFESELYHKVIGQCKKGTDFEAEESFISALKDENIHKEILEKAMEFIKKGKDIPDSMLNPIK